MKPGSEDKPYPILITGRELEELQKLTWMMAEAYGLDRRIEAYQGKRSIGLYRWDMDCLLDVINEALTGRWDYLTRPDLDHQALKSLRDRLQQLSDQAYADLDRK